jgi:predicted nucleic acid-binding protein
MVLIPRAVYREVVEQGEGYAVMGQVRAARGVFLRVQAVLDSNRSTQIAARQLLGTGESEAIVLAQESGAGALLMDDHRAIRYARSLGIPVTRTPMLYAEAKARGWIPNVWDKLDAMRMNGFRLKDADYRLVLSKLGEL